MTRARNVADSGLVLINTTSFTTASSVSLNNVFTTQYNSYQVYIDSISSVSDNLSLRLRASGTDNSTSSSYIRQFMRTYSTTSGGNIETLSLIYIASQSASYRNINTIRINQPASAVQTSFMIQGGGPDYTLVANGIHNVSSAFDGLTITPVTGTITGTIRIYGMN